VISTDEVGSRRIQGSKDPQREVAATSTEAQAPCGRLKIHCEWRVEAVRPRILHRSGKTCWPNDPALQVPARYDRPAHQWGTADEDPPLRKRRARGSHSSLAVLHLHTASCSSQSPTSHLSPIMAVAAWIASHQQSCQGTSTAVIALSRTTSCFMSLRPGAISFRLLIAGSCQKIENHIQR
jgi:hypothetical protein